MVGASCASIVAIGFVVGTIRDLPFWTRAWHLTLTIAALVSSWLLIQTVFTFHYAHRYYAGPHGEPAPVAALLFPGGREPDYLDFAYYSFVVGMTSQVSDVAVASRTMRRLTWSTASSRSCSTSRCSRSASTSSPAWSRAVR